MISAAGSSSGKTTVMMALVSALTMQGKKVQCFKTGPDYIDPMFHETASGRKSFHADAFFSDSDTIKNIMGSVSEDADIAVTEGAMGYYDGIGSTSEASAFSTASITSTPVILVVNPQGMGISCAALIKGFRDFRENSMIRGVILNRIKPGMYSYYREIIEKETGLKVAGYLPEMKNTELKSRHLGLVTAEETENISEIINELGKKACETIDTGLIFKIASGAPEFSYVPFFTESERKYRLGIARDRAFCFYYEENLKMLENAGAEPVYFSPLKDSSLPDDIDGIYFGGGYPELYADELGRNHIFINILKEAVNSGIPIFAECGGFMYLQEGIYDKEGCFHSMAGVLSGTSSQCDRLVRFGYITLECEEDNVLCKKGIRMKAHEFHYSNSTENGSSFTARKPGGREWKAVVCKENITAGYPHIYFPSCPEAVTGFSSRCIKFRESRLSK